MSWRLRPRLESNESRGGALDVKQATGASRLCPARPSRERPRGARFTLSDVARESGFSTATVERALNNRAGVRERTREIVVDAANGLAILPKSAAPPTRAAPCAGSAGVHSARRSEHVHSRASWAARGSSGLRTNGRGADHRHRGLQPRPAGAGAGEGSRQRERRRESSLSTIRRFAKRSAGFPRRGQGRHPGLRHPARPARRLRGNRQPGGRPARWLSARPFPAAHPNRRKVALFVGSLSYRGHEEREMGFRHIVAEEFPNLEIVELREVKDDAETAFSEASPPPRRHRDLAGIYNIGGRERGHRACARRPAFGEPARIRRA